MTDHCHACIEIDAIREENAELQERIAKLEAVVKAARRYSGNFSHSSYLDDAKEQLQLALAAIDA
ncbi:MAG: hypothetical protein Q7R41_13075, partial [Phycisphaerales bacterium]|nr:hypothetical protein [Phycisphaerales bacterium]